MWFPTLTHPVEQPYRLRYITEIFYITSAVLIALLVLLNVILVGYEDTTVLQWDPNIDPEYWWAPKSLPSALRFRTRPRECEATTLPLDTPLRTNSSLPFFSYYLLRNLSQYLTESEPDTNTEPAYKADPMGKCQVENMTIVLEPKMPTFTISTSILCDSVGDIDYARRFKTSFQRSPNSVLRPDSIVDFLTLTKTPEGTQRALAIGSHKYPNGSYIHALGVIDALAADLLHMMWMIRVTYESNRPSPKRVPGQGYLVWYAQKDSLPPTSSLRMERIYEGFVKDINTTIVNMLLSIRDAIHLDVGSVTPTNIYMSKDSFNSLIQVDPLYDTLHQRMWELKRIKNGLCTRGWGCLKDPNTTWAKTLTRSAQPVNDISLPIVPSSPRYPTVIKITYTCSQYQIKSSGSLLAAVFAGTFSMYLAVHGVFAWLAPGLDRKYKGPQPWEQSRDHCTWRSTHEAHSTPPTAQSLSFGYASLRQTPGDEGNRERSNYKDGEEGVSMLT